MVHRYGSKTGGPSGGNARGTRWTPQRLRLWTLRTGSERNSTASCNHSLTQTRCTVQLTRRTTIGQPRWEFFFKQAHFITLFYTVIDQNIFKKMVISVRDDRFYAVYARVFFRSILYNFYFVITDFLNIFIFCKRRHTIPYISYILVLNF